jgi:CubicO group peptidase (beta-lactamase class C family)
MRGAAAWIDDFTGDRRVMSASGRVLVDGEVVFSHHSGLARGDSLVGVGPDQAYDLASVTKALAGATVAASLADEGLLDVDAEVAETLEGAPPGITARQLLSHSSGYPAHVKLYADETGPWGTAGTRRRILERARRVPLAHAPGTTHVYSDVGYLVLLDLLETLGGAPIDALFLDRVRKPAGYPDLRWGWPQAAATEACPVRGSIIQGTVHDLNAAALGGVSSHAGLFGTASAVALLAQKILWSVRGDPRGDGLPGRRLAQWWAAESVGTHRGGWDRPSPGKSSTGQGFPPDTVGHLGYTGTSLWMSPSQNTVVVLLTNRIHPVDDLQHIRALRPGFHDAVATGLGWLKGP